MGVAVGIDVAKEFHWVRAISSERSELLIDRRVDNQPPDLAALVEQLEALRDEHGDLRVGIDVVGGIAGLLTAMLLEASIEVVHVSGLAVNRARQGTTGGEHKSDPRDAAVIAEQVLRRRDLRPVEALTELDAEIRHAGRRRLVDHIARAGRLPRRHVEDLAERTLAAAEAQTVAVPGERVAAELVRELALEAERTRARLAELDAELELALERHPDAALIRSLPGMGVTLTAEFIAEAGSIERFPTADRLAAAAGLAPVLKQSGKVRYLKRATGGNKTLKRVFFQSAFCSLSHPASKAFYARKRSERKSHHQAVIALARRRVDVLHAMLRNREPYRLPPALAA
jgi:transposase